MSKENNNGEIFFEDISSSSRPAKKMPLPKNFSNNFVSHLDSIIKSISFIVAIAILIVFVAIAAILIILDSIFTVVAIGVLIVGLILALFSLFIIYGLGHMIAQNNEILKRL